MSDDTTARTDSTPDAPRDASQRQAQLAEDTLESVAGGCYGLPQDAILHPLPPLTTFPIEPGDGGILR